MQISNRILSTGGTVIWGLLVTVLTTQAVAGGSLAVSTGAATLTGTATFDAGGNVIDNGGSPLTARGICWNTTGTPTISDSHTDDGTDMGAFVSSVTGLSENTLYYFRAYVSNSDETSYGEQRTIITGSTAPIHGYTWNELQPDGNNDLSLQKSAMSFDASVIILGAYDYGWMSDGRLYASVDSGATWTERQPAGNVDRNWACMAVSFDGARMIAGAASGGRLYTSDDFGETWTQRQPAGDVDRNWAVADISSDGTRMIAGSYAGRLYVSDDSGETWTETQPAGDDDIPWRIVSMSSDGYTIVCGYQQGRLYTSTDGGSTWTERQPGGDTDLDWSASDMSSDGTVIAIGTYFNRLYISQDSGATWTDSQPSGDEDNDWYSVAISADGSKILAVNASQQVYLSTDTGANWSNSQPIESTDCWTSLSMSTDGTVSLGILDSGHAYLGTPIVKPTVTTASASDIELATTKTGGTVENDGGAAITARGVCYSTSPNPDLGSNKTDNGTGTGTFDSSLTGLQPNTTYYVRAYATNIAGTSYGNQITFTTLADTDGDGTPDTTDGCPSDANKTSAGTCGCGVADTDSDSDGTPNCNDACPTDADKTSPGICGCGTPDTDTDQDGTPDCNDGCPNNPNMTEPVAGSCEASELVDSDVPDEGSTPDQNNGVQSTAFTLCGAMGIAPLLACLFALGIMRTTYRYSRGR